MRDDDFDFSKELMGAFKDCRRREEEFKRLLVEPSTSTRVPDIGDRVVVAAGFVGLGHLWVREEAVVEEKGDTSYKVRFVNFKPYNGGDRGSYVMWIHPALITDVLGEVKDV